MTIAEPTSVQLIHFDKARQELALASSIDEVKMIRDQAEAIRQYIKQQKGSFEMQNQAAEIKLRAERRAGEMLKAADKAKGGEQYHSNPTSCTVQPVPSYADLGLEKTQAMRWQLEAEIPEEKFEQFIAETKAAAEELTSKAAISIATKIVREQKRKDAPPLPTDIYNVIYADPPWQYDNTGVTASAETHYPTMSIDQLCSLPVQADDNAVLFLWATNPFLQDALSVVEAWGFEYKTNIVWVKTQLVKPGIGFYVRGRHELLFICTKGSFLPKQDISPVSSVVEAPVQEHSKKPELFYNLIETLYPEGKYLELFLRGKPHSDRWKGWGNEGQG